MQKRKSDAEEEHFSAEELKAEVYLALKDCFEASIQTEKDGIDLHFFNGQHFVVTVEEVGK